MEFQLKEPPNGMTKVFILSNEERTLEIKLSLITRRSSEKKGEKKVQANKLTFQGESHIRWKVPGYHVSLIDLIEKCINFNFDGDRQELIDYIYFTEKGCI